MYSIIYIHYPKHDQNQEEYVIINEIHISLLDLVPQLLAWQVGLRVDGDFVGHGFDSRFHQKLFLSNFNNDFLIMIP